MGIGGGPIELMALSYLFSMDSKKAAANSLYIIMFSQMAALIQTGITAQIPTFNPVTLIGMAIAGIVGGIIGSTLNKKLMSSKIELLYRGVLVVIMLICLFNTLRYIGLIF